MAAVCCRVDRTRERGCGYTTTNSEASNSAGFVFTWCTARHDKTERRWKNFTDAVAFHIAVDMAPIYTAGFQHLFHVLDPRYKPQGQWGNYLQNVQ